jgi:hypothetical protein
MTWPAADLAKPTAAAQPRLTAGILATHGIMAVTQRRPQLTGRAILKALTPDPWITAESAPLPPHLSDPRRSAS